MARAKKVSQGDGVRSFPALPPTPGRRAFAESWWGKEWITALEETSMDSGRLSRGRTYARGGHVAEITVSPGRITAKVYGSQPRPYKSTVYIRTFSGSEWETLLDMAAGKAVHLAAILDRDLPQGLADDAAEAGVSLLPRVNELEPECSCPDWGYPCKHAAALCYQVSRILDQDPFVLLLMRGRDEPAIMEELHRRNAAHAALERAADERSAAVPPARRPERGTPAREAFAAWPLPSVVSLPLPAPVKDMGLPAVIDASDDPDGVSAPALEMLVADAAVRAKELLDVYLDEGAASNSDPRPPVPKLDPRRDAVRLLAGEHRDVDVFARLIGAFGFEPMQMMRSILAWRFGGSAGLETLEEPWTPPSDEFARARAEFASSWGEEEPPAFKTWRNRWTFAEYDAQLRYGRDGGWYPYRRLNGEWTPAGRPSGDPAAALTDLLDHAAAQAVSR